MTNSFIDIRALDVILVGTTSEIQTLGVKVIDTDLGRIAIVFDGEDFFAIQNACPHREGPFSLGKIERGTITCPLHEWRFDLKTGEHLGSPKCRASIYSLSTVGDEIFLDLKAAEKVP